MSHEIENNNGTARFAYNQNNGHPWHKLGVPMTGLQTIDAMLQAAQADYHVDLVNIAAVDTEGNVLTNPDGTPIIIHDSRATIRRNNDGTVTPLASVGTRYTVKQNREVAERALQVVGASTQDAVVDTAGVLFDGKRFFMTIDLGALIIDPAGIEDKICRYLVVSCGHDGVWPIRYANTDIRAVCNNTVMLGLNEAQRIFTARHTKNVETAFEDARTVLGMSTQWATEFKQMAEKLLSIPVRPGTGEIDKVLNTVFPKKTGETNRQQKNRENTNDLIRHIYNNDNNAGTYGQNGWTMYNAIGEYLDHHRPAKPHDLAYASIDEHSWVSHTKIAAQQAVLNLT